MSGVPRDHPHCLEEFGTYGQFPLPYGFAGIKVLCSPPLAGYHLHYDISERNIPFVPSCVERNILIAVSRKEDMFYSHEVLTSRKYGVATVWLVATLGSKSNLKKINRKAILDVNVPKACETILMPEAPMALRLQSSLLYGVSRVYSQQVFYVLADAQNAQANMKALLKVIKTAELDPEAGKARPDQLVLQDDPAFLPDFFLPSLDMDLLALDLSMEGSYKRTSLLSSQFGNSEQSSDRKLEESLLGIVIPTSDTGNSGDLGGSILPRSDLGSASRGNRLRNLLEDDEEGFLPNIDFDFDAEGNIVDYGADRPIQEDDGAAASLTRVRSDSAASARVLREHEEGLRHIQLDLGGTMDLDPDIFRPGENDEENGLLPAEPFPEMMPRSIPQPNFPKSSSAVPEEEDSAESMAVPWRRKNRSPKAIPMDMAQELRNADLAMWNKNYLNNMAETSHAKAHYKLPAQAKKNAFFWTFGSGVGDVGVGVGSSKLQSPLEIFAGEMLIGALTGVKPSSSEKRARSDEQDHESANEERRVRAKGDSGEQLGRGNDLALDDDDIRQVFDDTGIEIGRDAGPLLEDHSIQMPWNISASVHESRQASRQGSLTRGRGFTSSVGGFSTNVGGPGSLPPTVGSMLGSFDRRASRLTSASPLVGRGLEPPSNFGLPTHEGDEEFFDGRPASDNPALDNFQWYGPAASVDTQTAAQSQWLRTTLNRESTNFLEFVGAELDNKYGYAKEDRSLINHNDQPVRMVVFEELLPPSQHTKTVAAQAFHHVLALATKGLLIAQQETAYGPLYLGFP